MTTATFVPIDEMPRTRASDVKKDGWRSIVKQVDLTGTVLVTNHNEPAVVIVSVDMYEELVVAAGAAKTKVENGLDMLRARFDERLAVLKSGAAGENLRAAMAGPTRLRGRVKAGTTF